MNTPTLPSAQEIISRVERCWLAAAEQTQVAALSSEGQATAAYFIEVGDHFYKHTNNPTSLSEADIEGLVYTFEWPEGAKRFMLLWRNILLEKERSYVLELEGLAQSGDLSTLSEASKNALYKAAEHWMAQTQASIEALSHNEKKKAEKLYEWRLQDSPWPVYKKQLQEIAQQLFSLQRGYASRIEATSTIGNLRNELSVASERLEAAFSELKLRAEKALVIVATDAKTSAESTAKIEALEGLDPADAFPNFIKELAGKSNDIVDQLPDKATFYVLAPNGQLQYRDIQLERQVGQWISAEILPSLQSSGQRLERISADFGRTLIEVKSRLLLAQDWLSTQVESTSGQEEQDATPDLDGLINPLENFLKRLKIIAEESLAEANTAVAKTHNELRISSLYDARSSFLEVSFEAGFSQVKRSQDAFLSNFNNWFQKKKRALQKLRVRLAKEESLSVGERIVRVLQERKIDSNNAAYSNVLVTRGFIGEAFHAGRETEIERAEEAIAASKRGFRGAIAVTGQRYCGKTHFAELLAGRYFEQKCVRIKPGELFEVAGRKMEASFDLREALSFLRKHSTGMRVMLLIDDLELWSDSNFSLTTNARALQEAMDDLSGRIFFVVTMGNWTLDRLKEGINFSSSFQQEINLDTMSLESFKQTVSARHVATHHRLVNADRKELSEREFFDHAASVFRAAKGNVGDGLRRWAQSVKRCDVAQVMLVEKENYLLPNFIDSDIGVVLAAIKRKRYANEYELRKLFGPSFDQQFRAIVRRLLRLEILVRHRSGSLSINPVISNEIARLLQRDGHLRAFPSRTPIQL